MSAEYHAYLLRLHRGEDSQKWRATLENAHTGEVIRFASHQEMMLHLMRKLRDAQPPVTDAIQPDVNE